MLLEKALAVTHQIWKVTIQSVIDLVSLFERKTCSPSAPWSQLWDPLRLIHTGKSCTTSYCPPIAPNFSQMLSSMAPLCYVDRSWVGPFLSPIVYGTHTVPSLTPGGYWFPTCKRQTMILIYNAIIISMEINNGLGSMVCIQTVTKKN